MQTNDIVVRLRLWSDNAKEQDADEIVVGLCKAADEIERLRRDYSCICNEMRRMMNERDEARREVCVLMQRTGFLRGDYASERGWDCFKEDTDAA